MKKEKLIYFHCVLGDPSEEPKILEPYEIEMVEWVPAEEVIGRFTSDVHETIREFVLRHARQKELVD